jgi:Predicted transcriptional regulators
VYFTLWEIKGLKNRIQELRRERRMTQEELAAGCQVTRQTIISLEGGRYNPSIFLARKIARIFGLAIEQVFIFEEDEP